jgi:predicted amidophosphoribosyltransferase
VNRYSEFCEHCGADLIAEEKLLKCAKCGAEVYEGTKHCPECGARIVGPKAPKKPKTAKPPEEGWDTPIDATTGVPPPRRPDED